jgi:D-serine deaminase-like pyridoxal phosphate-dependent protein
VQRVTETGNDVLRQAAEMTRDLTQQWSALVSFDTPEAKNAVRRANAALQAARGCRQLSQIRVAAN